MADTKVSALTAASALDGTEPFPVVQGGASKKATISQIKTYIGDPTVYVVHTAAADVNSTVTPAAMAGIAPTVGIGTYVIQGWLTWKTAATTTGIELYLNHTGTATRCLATFVTPTTATSTATGVADLSTTTTAQYQEVKAQRANNTATGVTQGVDTADTVEMTKLDALLTVTASGTLNIMFRSEVAASAATMMAGSALFITKIA